MEKELERLVGFLLDICDAEGDRPMAAMLDCPVCRQPLGMLIDPIDRELRVWCRAERSHFAWEGDYNRLPAWIVEYEKLNRADPW